MIQYYIQSALQSLSACFQPDPEVKEVMDKHATPISTAKKTLASTRILNRMERRLMKEAHYNERIALYDKQREELLSFDEQAEDRLAAAQAAVAVAKEKRNVDLQRARHAVTMRKLGVEVQQACHA